ncbi:MAG: RMD1 family protein [Spirochaetota bacterium]
MAKKIPVTGHYYNAPIDLKRFRERLKPYKLHSVDPLVCELVNDRFVVITKFGVVMFWNTTDDLERSIREELTKFLTDFSVDERVSDRIDIELGATERIGFERVQLSKLSPDKIKLISLAFAQSIALNKFELDITSILGKIEGYINELKTSGKLRIKPARILKSVGFALSVKYHVINNLVLFDKPDETWEDERLSRLYRDIREYFDLTDRHEGITVKLDFITDNVETLLDLLNTQRMVWLDVTIVLLIIAEVIIFLMQIFVFNGH